MLSYRVRAGCWKYGLTARIEGTCRNVSDRHFVAEHEKHTNVPALNCAMLHNTPVCSTPERPFLYLYVQAMTAPHSQTRQQHLHSYTLSLGKALQFQVRDCC